MDTHSAIIPFGLVERHTAGVTRLGLSIEGLLEASMITRQFGDARDRITPAQYLLLCANTSLGIDDASHGFAKVALGPSYAPIGVRLAFAYPNLEGALVALAKFYRSVSNAINYKLTYSHNTVTLSVTIDAWNDKDGAHNEELQLCWLFMNCLEFLGYPLPILQVTVRDPFHFNLNRQHWAIGGRVRYGDTTSFVFPRRLLAAPPGRTAGQMAFWDCHRHWLDHVETVRSTAPLSRYVCENDIVRFANMVKVAGKSANAVRHDLQASTGGYRDTRRSVLTKAISDRLRSSDDCMDTIAFDHAFSDARSLRRFIKKATGQTPGQIRRNDDRCPENDDVRALQKLKKITELMSI